ncbi:MAG: hypothetical protein KatS3mg109_1313 [Pirellulaceae bacterium]|nr:MAG: hypothetical protein KatS3mg109_1313 [Pirellulaceae bacterium]GIW92709.1 MAG: hypothetical protein KatS3mg110_0750 [Pirellulaceae bacterium]
MEPYVWPILLLVLGIFFLVLELFIPSTGILSLLALGSFVAAVYLAFASSITFGVVILLTTLFAIPIFIVLAINVWPHTPIGRRIVLRPSPQEDAASWVDQEQERRRNQLLGKVGVARSKMLPCGVISIDGHTYDAVSRGGAIEPGQAVRVVSVSANRIVVAPLRAGTETSETPPSTSPGQTFDNLELDSLDGSST